MGITGGGHDFEDTVVDSKDGDIKGPTPQIVDDDLAFLAALVETVGQSSRGGLVDNTEDVETGDCTGILGGGTLSVVEVGGDGDDSVGDLFTQVCLGDLLHLLENHGADFFGGEGLGLSVRLLVVATRW